LCKLLSLQVAQPLAQFSHACAHLAERRVMSCDLCAQLFALRRDRRQSLAAPGKLRLEFSRLRTRLISPLLQRLALLSLHCVRRAAARHLFLLRPSLRQQVVGLSLNLLDTLGRLTLRLFQLTNTRLRRLDLLLDAPSLGGELIGERGVGLRLARRAL